jgi:hypothetical protein
VTCPATWADLRTSPHAGHSMVHDENGAQSWTPVTNTDPNSRTILHPRRGTRTARKPLRVPHRTCCLASVIEARYGSEGQVGPTQTVATPPKWGQIRPSFSLLTIEPARRDTTGPNDTHISCEAWRLGRVPGHHVITSSGRASPRDVRQLRSLRSVHRRPYCQRWPGPSELHRGT